MPYSDYAVEGKSEQDGEPSPSNPSEIHSVADDVNLLPYPYKDTTNSPINSNGITWNDNGDGTVVANGTPTGFTSFFIKDINNPISVLPNTTYTLSGGSITDGVVLNFTEYDDNNNVITTHDNVTTKTFTTSSSTTKLVGMLKRYSNSISINNFTIKPKLQKGTVATPYSPYNQGTVTIKQRGKNLWTSNLPILFSDRSSIVQDNNNGGIDMTIASSASLGYIFYDLGLISDFAGKTLTFSISNEPNVLYKWCAFVTCNADGSNRQELKNFYGNNQITYTVGNNYSQTHLAIRLYISDGTPNTTYSINNVQVEENSEKTSYEPYQGYDKVFQTEPLRSLPNGVKDTIEADGVHRRVGKRLLQASDIYDIVTTGTIPYVRIEKGSTLGMVSGTFANDTARMKSYKITGNVNYVNTNNGEFNTYWDRFYLAIFDNRFTDLATAKQLLEGEEIIYQLKEETTEPLSQNQATTMLDIIKTGSYEGTTNIYTDEDVKPTIEVGYYKYGETGGLPTVENEKLIFDKELQIDREELIF